MNDTLVTTFRLDDSDYRRGAKSIERETLAVGRAIDSVRAKASKRIDFGTELFGKTSTAAKSILGPLVAVEAAIIGATTAASREAADFEALSIALQAVEGDAGRARESLQELKGIAKGPGLGIEEAIKTYQGLRRGDISKDIAMEITRQLGNAVAFSGGGREELGRAGYALSQMAVKGKVSGEELLQLSDAGIAGSKMLRNRFGTADAGELEKLGVDAKKALKALAEEMAKIPRVGGGAKNTIENTLESIEQRFIQFGEGANRSLIPFFKDAGDMMDKLGEKDILGAAGEAIGTQLISILESVTGGADLETAIESLTKATLMVGFGVQNLAENLKGVKGIGEDFISDVSDFLLDYTAGTGLHGKLAADAIREKAAKKDGIMSIEERAEEAFASEKRNAENRKSAKLKGRINANGKREIWTGTEWVLESELTTEQRARAEATKSGPNSPKPDISAIPDEKKGKPDIGQGQEIKALLGIERNTRRAVEELEGLRHGGGAFTDRHINPYNMSQLTGGRGSKGIPGAIMTLLDAFEQEFGRRLLTYTKQGHFNPG